VTRIHDLGDGGVSITILSRASASPTEQAPPIDRLLVIAKQLVSEFRLYRVIHRDLGPRTSSSTRRERHLGLPWPNRSKPEYTLRENCSARRSTSHPSRFKACPPTTGAICTPWA
jgi:hypothetical protein